jgi:hypothetical protein
LTFYYAYVIIYIWADKPRSHYQGVVELLFLIGGMFILAYGCYAAEDPEALTTKRGAGRAAWFSLGVIAVMILGVFYTFNASLPFLGDIHWWLGAPIYTLCCCLVIKVYVALDELPSPCPIR